MKPYFDFGFFTLLMVNAPGSKTAWEILRNASPPYEINYLHALQIENLFARGKIEGDSRQRTIATSGSRFWRGYLDEAVFALNDADFGVAFRLALRLNALSVSRVPAPALLLHPALAAAQRATRFLSFDPRSRALAQALGIHLLPETR